MSRHRSGLATDDAPAIMGLWLLKVCLLDNSLHFRRWPVKVGLLLPVCPVSHDRNLE